MTSSAQVKKWIAAIDKDLDVLKRMSKKYDHRGNLARFDFYESNCGYVTYVAGGIEQATDSMKTVRSELRKQLRRMN